MSRSHSPRHCAAREREWLGKFNLSRHDVAHSKSLRTLLHSPNSLSRTSKPFGAKLSELEHIHALSYLSCSLSLCHRNYGTYEFLVHPPPEWWPPSIFSAITLVATSCIPEWPPPDRCGFHHSSAYPDCRCVARIGRGRSIGQISGHADDWTQI